MDAYISYTSLFLIFIQLSTAISFSPDDSNLSKAGCRLCKPGYHAERNCTDIHGTICAPCPVKHFTDTYNIFQQCSTCSVCGEGLFEFTPCSPSSDVFCQSCEIVKTFDNISYRNVCLGQPDENVLEKDLILANDTKIHTQDIELGSGELPVENGELSFGKDALLSQKGLNVDYIIPSENITDLKLHNETEENGSGSIDVVIHTFSAQLSNASFSEVTPDLIEDELIPVTTAEFLEENKTTTQTVLKSSTTTSSEVNYHAIPAIAASRKTEEDNSDTVTVGVVVAVGIVAAIIFFIFGFLASRYWRRRRQSFQIMKKVDKNGTPASFGSTDSKGNDVDPGIYDEIGKGSNGNYSPTKTPPPEEDLYAVPLKKSSVPKTNRTPSFDNISSIEGIKYIDETTDDEADTSPKDQLLKTKEKEVKNKEKMNGSTPRNSANLSSIGEEKQPMLLKGESIAV